MLVIYLPPIAKETDRIFLVSFVSATVGNDRANYKKIPAKLIHSEMSLSDDFVLYLNFDARVD